MSEELAYKARPSEMMELMMLGSSLGAAKGLILGCILVAALIIAVSLIVAWWYLFLLIVPIAGLGLLVREYRNDRRQIEAIKSDIRARPIDEGV